MSSKVTFVDEQLGLRMKELREANPEVSLARLGKVLSMSYQSYGEMERGRVSIRVSTVLRLCEFYNITIGEFIGPKKVAPTENIGMTQNILAAMPKLTQEEAREVHWLALRFARGKSDGAKRRRTSPAGNDTGSLPGKS